MGFRKPITVRGLRGGAFVNGIWSGQTEEEFTICASVQPASGRDLQSLEEGRRTRQSYKVFSDKELYALENGQNPDRISYLGKDHEVVTCSAFRSGVIN